MTRYIFATGDADPIPLHSEERRFTVCYERSTQRRYTNSLFMTDFSARRAVEGGSSYTPECFHELTEAGI